MFIVPPKRCALSQQNFSNQALFAKRLTPVRRGIHMQDEFLLGLSKFGEFSSRQSARIGDKAARTGRAIGLQNRAHATL
jgi:hypothetical protein